MGMGSRSIGTALVIGGALLALALPAAAEEAFNLDALVAAAKKEAPITVYDSTGKIVDQAKAFTAKYGVKATGLKVTSANQFEMITREAQARNIQGDVLLISDVPAALAQLMPDKSIVSWLPPDAAAKIPKIFQNPLVVATDPSVWAYNTGVYKSCPVSNVWELTDPKWKGKVAIYDPLIKTSYPDWFNEMALHADAAMARAYKDLYGKDLKTSEKSATAAWVKALAANAPLIADADERISEAVGAPGQSAPFIGLLSTAKFRNNKDMGYKLGLCAGIEPFAGFAVPKLGVIAAGSKSPNAAKLFVHYLTTAEGLGPQVADGKLPTNSDIKLPEDEPSGVGAVLDKIFQFDSATALNDWDARQDWQDFWRVNYKR
jgi:iron(III) transport system substrate-binding protein